MSRSDYDDLPLGADSGRPFGLEPEGRSGAARWLAVVAVLALAGAGAWYFWRREKPEPEAAVSEAAAAPAGEAAPAAETASVPPTVPLPALGASDEFVRRLLTGLSEQPRFARWLASENVVRRFVAAVDNVAEGTSPVVHLRPLGPESAFRAGAAAGGGPTVIEAASYRRYDPLVESFVSLPSERLANLYRELRPLFDQAYSELGYPGKAFEDRLREAIANLLAVEVPAGPVEVKRRVVTYEFVDPELESRSAAAKHLMRLGPENARRVQAKLREVAAALAIPVS